MDLVKDVVPVPLGGDADQDVEASGALLDQNLPPVVIILLSLQAPHFHAVQQIVGALNERNKNVSCKCLNCILL